MTDLRSPSECKEGSVAANIPKLYFIKGFRWFLLIIPIIVPFYQSNYLTMQQIMILQAFFSFSIVLIEVPSGYLADVLGRKGALATGLGVSFVGLLTYSLSSGFWGFLFAEVVLGFGASCISGADSALLYDSLLQLSRQDDYKKCEGRSQAIGNFSEGTASVLGGFAALVSMRFPFYLQTALTIPALLIAVSLVEPKFHQENRRKPSLWEVFSVAKFALHENRQLKWLLIYSAVIGSSTITMVWFTQPYFKMVGLPLPLFGVVWATFQFSIGIFSLFAHSIEKSLGKPLMLSLVVILVGIGYLSVGLTKALWGIGFIAIFQLVRGMNGPLLFAYINTLTVPRIRATILSLNSLLFRLIFSVVGPVFGYISDRFTLKAALLSCAGFFFSFGMLALVFLLRSGALSEGPQSVGGLTEASV